MVAVTHDDEWASVLDTDEEVPDHGELIRRISNKFDIFISFGGVCLHARRTNMALGTPAGQEMTVDAQLTAVDTQDMDDSGSQSPRTEKPKVKTTKGARGFQASSLSPSASSNFSSGGGGGGPRRSESHYRTELDKIVAARGLSLEYKDTSAGPLNNAQWTSIVYVNRVEYGRGYGRTKGGARENAAGQAAGLIAQGY